MQTIKTRALTELHIKKAEVPLLKCRKMGVEAGLIVQSEVHEPRRCFARWINEHEESYDVTIFILWDLVFSRLAIRGYSLNGSDAAV